MAVIALQAALHRFNHLVDWFVPAELAADRAMRKQAQMFLVSHICGPFIGNTVPAAILVFDPHPGAANFVLFCSITGFWIFPFLLKYFNHYNLLAILSIQNLMFSIIWSCLMLGGVQSPTVPWVLTIPLLSFFYLGTAPDIRLMILVMFMANFAAFWTMSGQVPIESHIATLPMQWLGVISTAAAAAYVAMMALFYAKALSSQGELEAEMRDHVATALALRRAAAAADRADAAKAAFLTRLSGDLRIPLHGVIGYSSMLIEDLDEQVDANAARDLQTIREAGLDLLRSVNDILDLSRLEAGRMEIFSDTVDPADLLQDVVDEMGANAAANGNSLRLSLDPSLTPFMSDMRKLRVVLVHLVSNAAKFTTAGQIEIWAGLRSSDGMRPACFVFSVTDSGVGIAPERVPQLFEQFALNNDSRASRFGGSGLGLALSRKLCRLLGGDLEVETAPDRGSRFSAWVPAGVALPSAPPTRPADRDLGALRNAMRMPILQPVGTPETAA